MSFPYLLSREVEVNTLATSLEREGKEKDQNKFPREIESERTAFLSAEGENGGRRGGNKREDEEQHKEQNGRKALDNHGIALHFAEISPLPPSAPRPS